MASVTLTGVSKRFGSRTAIDNLTLHVRDREFLVLVGPSGCGKSTALRLIAGLMQPSTGDIFLDDRRITDVRAAKRDVAMVFQNYALYPHMTVFENLSFPLRLRKMSKREVVQKVKNTAELLNIEKLLNNKPKELSGGERQRVALGRAIVREPRVFLMDEPLSNLDAKLRVQTRSELVKLQRRLATTTIYVTHDQSEAMTMGDRIAVLRDGMLLQVDEPQRIYDSPANAFVGAFFGICGMNVFKCTVEGGEGTIRLEGEPLKLGVPEGVAQTWSEKEISVGVRPEHVTILDAANDHGMPAAVELVENFGSEKLVHLVSGGFSFSARVSASDGQVIGSRVKVMLQHQHLKFFNRQTGEALC